MTHPAPKTKNILTQGGCFFTAYQNNPVGPTTKTNKIEIFFGDL